MVIGEVEAGYDSASQESQLAVSDELCPLPDASRDQDLHMLPGCQIRAERQNGSAAVREQLKHFDRVAEVEVEHFVGVENVQLRELSLFEQVVDRGALGPHAAGEIEVCSGGVGTPERSAFNRVGIEVEQVLYLVGRHMRIVRDEVEFGV